LHFLFLVPHNQESRARLRFKSSHQEIGYAHLLLEPGTQPLVIDVGKTLRLFHLTQQYYDIKSVFGTLYSFPLHRPHMQRDLSPYPLLCPRAKKIPFIFLFVNYMIWAVSNQINSRFRWN
jgi:hypothetical protein